MAETVDQGSGIGTRPDVNSSRACDRRVRGLEQRERIPERFNEATIQFLDDDEMVILLRRNKTAWIGTSGPPHTPWNWPDTGHQIGGPNFVRLPDGSMWAAGRRYGKKATTVLARMTRNSYQVVLTLVPQVAFGIP